MLDFALVVTFLAWHTIITFDAIGVIGLDRERRRLEFLGCPGLFPRDKNAFFHIFFFTLNAFPVFLTPQSVCESHDDIWNLPFLGTRKPEAY